MTTTKRKKSHSLLIFLIISVIVTGSAFATQKYLKVDNPVQLTSSNYKSENWNLILVNQNNFMPENYSFNKTTVGDGFEIDERIYDDLQNMFNDMRAAEIYPQINSAYRNPEQQQEIMDNKIAEYVSKGLPEFMAKSKAKKTVAQVGTSEHETGLALDIAAQDDLSTDWEVYNWLAKNAHNYGFIMRYPEDKTKTTGIDYEPWHYRYVGKEIANEITSNNLCLEEYLKN